MKAKMIYILVAFFLCCLAYFLWENCHFTVTEYVYESEALPSAMDGLRILQLSDLHGQSFGKDNEKLLNAIRNCKPDAIMITGDLIDSTFTDPAAGIRLVERSVTIAPVYYCTGNHEHRLEEKELQGFLSDLAATGATVLADRAVSFRGGILVGLTDPTAKEPQALKKLLEPMGEDCFTLLLSHKPHYFSNYTQADLALSGHAHGGQLRLPLLGGLYAPGQGFFPEYTKGFYSLENTTMLVSRGAGNSHRFPRLFNTPELILLTLRRP